MISNLLFFPLIHPFFIGLCFFIAGIYAQSIEYNPLIILSFILIFIANFFYKKCNSIQLLVLIGTFFTGNYAYHYQFSNHNNFFRVINGNKPYIVTGSISSIQDLQFKRYSRYCILKNVTILENNTHKIIYKDFCIGLYSNNFNDLCIDDEISLQAISLKNQNSTSYQHYLIKEGLLATSFLSNECKPLLLYRPQFSINRWIFNKKNELLQSLKNKMSSPSFTFFSSLFLGNKTNTFHYEKLKEQFKNWGLSHYLARSGLHLILFIALWKFLLRFIPIAFILKHLILSSIVMLYFMLSWSSLPFTRSCISYLIYFIYILTNKQIDSLHILTLVTWLILLSNPVQLFSLDFQLSFGLTFALIWFSRLQTIAKKKIIPSN